ncbi:MAG: glutamate synthase [Candidatus Avilachnospira sp.]|jgi:glutamate synthase domain-containing protein 3
MLINAKGIDHKKLNDMLRGAGNDFIIEECLGQRFIAAGMSDKHIEINGIPGNALGAFLNGADIKVNGNAQDSVGDTMNSGSITICGNVGDAVGYAMRGGSIYVRGNAGYRAGIHMKEYRDRFPVIVIGGKAGSFLGEYQAGGIIIVLGLGVKDDNIVGNFPCTGMHGGKVFIRAAAGKIKFPRQVLSSPSGSEDMSIIEKYVSRFCEKFGYSPSAVMAHPFTTVYPDSANPYRQMYVSN